MDMFLFIEKGLRGAISIITHRYAKANNKYMKEYAVDKPSSYVTYLDANNLYVWAMSEYLPYNGFYWADEEDFDVMEIPDDSKYGYILEVDLEYPKNCMIYRIFIYPFCAEQVEIKP